MKKFDSVLRDYVSKLSFDNLKYLIERFDERMGPDLAEAVEFVSKNTEVDKMLLVARNYDEFWNLVDQISYHVEREFSRRMPDLVTHG